MPNWSQERVFGRWGPKNRTVFRVLLFVVVVALVVMGTVLASYIDYSRNLNDYIHEARAARNATQEIQDQRIRDNRRNIREGQRQVRDLACFVVQFSKAQPDYHGSAFIRNLDKRYECRHYRVRPTPIHHDGGGVTPGGSGPGPGSPGSPGSPPRSTSSSVPRPSPSRTPGPNPTPTHSPTSTAPPLPVPICGLVTMVPGLHCPSDLPLAQ